MGVSLLHTPRDRVVAIAAAEGVGTCRDPGPESATRISARKRGARTRGRSFTIEFTARTYRDSTQRSTRSRAWTTNDVGRHESRGETVHLGRGPAASK